jgi:hypothetical protein
MIETDFFACLVGLLQDADEGVCRSSIKAITALANFGRFIGCLQRLDMWPGCTLPARPNGHTNDERKQ